MTKSILIIGKGPSLHRYTNKFISKYDDIVLCGFPPIVDPINKIIENKNIPFHFCNCGSADYRYNLNIIKALKINSFIDIGAAETNEYIQFLKNINIYKRNIKKEYLKEFQSKYNFNQYGPSCCMYALLYILKTNEYNNIGFIGFDNFQKNQQTYYYKPELYNPSIKYLLHKKDGPIKKDGTFVEEKPLHDRNEVIECLDILFKQNPEITFSFTTNMILKNIHKNVNIFK